MWSNGKRKRGEEGGLSGSLSRSASCQDGTYDIPASSPSLPLIRTQGLSKALPGRWETLLSWQTFQREGGSIHRSKGGEEGKQTVLAERGVHVAAQTFQEVGQRRRLRVEVNEV